MNVWHSLNFWIPIWCKILTLITINDNNFWCIFLHNLMEPAIEYRENTQEQYFKVTFYCHWIIPDNVKTNEPLLSATLFTHVTQHVLTRKHNDNIVPSPYPLVLVRFTRPPWLYECNLYHIFTGGHNTRKIYYFNDINII